VTEQTACANTLALEKSAILASWSWRITGPLRFVGGVMIWHSFTLRRLANGLLSRSIHTLQRPLAATMHLVLRYPSFSHGLNQLLMRYPALYQQLLGIARRRGVMSNLRPHSVSELITKHIGSSEDSSMTPHARQIYNDLKESLKRKRPKNN
jgi:O-antigen chain-terminating methyltransferase